MKSTSLIIVTSSLLLATLAATPAFAGPKQLNRYHVTVDGHALRVVTFVDDSVKVIQGGMFGSAQSFELRDRMRRAVIEATHCTVTDDFFLDGKLVGKLDCAKDKDAGSVESAQ